MKNLEIIENYPDLDPSDADEIMLSNGWTTQEILDKNKHNSIYKVLQETDYYALAKIEEKTVGVLRASTDNGFSTTYLEIIVVHKEYQGKGIGRELMLAFNKNFSHTSIYAVTPIKQDRGAISFLEKFGFRDNENFTVCTRPGREDFI